MKFNLIYSPSQRRGVFFLLLIFVSYFSFLYLKKQFQETISPVTIVENQISPVHATIREIIIPINKNPNSWSKNDWIKMGFSNSQIRIVENYKKKINNFKTKKQLLKCYAFNDSNKKMLDSIVDFPTQVIRSNNQKSFIRILSSKKPNYNLKKYFDTLFYKKSSNKEFEYYVFNSPKNLRLVSQIKTLNNKEPKVLFLNPTYLNRIKSLSNRPTNYSKSVTSVFRVNINLADTSQWKKIKGIGEKRAIHILNYKKALGGFITASQLNEVYSISDSLFKSFDQYLQIKDSSILKINLNTCSIDELKSHPYIKWNVANAIVNFRVQHGTFKSLEDLKKIHILKDNLYYKIVPYLSINKSL